MGATSPAPILPKSNYNETMDITDVAEAETTSGVKVFQAGTRLVDGRAPDQRRPCTRRHGPGREPGLGPADRLSGYVVHPLRRLLRPALDVGAKGLKRLIGWKERI